MYMQQELFSEPSVIRNALNNNKAVVAQIANTVKSRGISNITIIGRGTSDNAGLCFKYITEILCGIPCGTAHPSVTTMFGAKVNYVDKTITVDARGINNYKIDENKCVGCLECVKHFSGGCFMKKVLRTKTNK